MRLDCLAGLDLGNVEAVLVCAGGPGWRDLFLLGLGTATLGVAAAVFVVALAVALWRAA